MAINASWERWLSQYRMARIRRRAFLGSIGAGGLSAAALLAGCGGKNNNQRQTSTQPPAPATAASRPPTSAATPAGSASPAAAASPAAVLPKPGQGGTIITHDNGDPASLDYIKTWSQRSMMYDSMVYPRLLKFAVGPGIGPIDFKITTDLAPTMPEQPDATTYIFKLQPAKWQDKAPLNGRALTAEDVLKNWDRFKTDHPSRLLLADVAKVEAVAPDTVKFTLSKPLGPFLNHIAHQGVFYILPYELFGTGKLETDMWSAGPFIFTGYQVGAQLSFERNPNYFVKDRPLAAGVVYKLIPDASTTIAALRSKQIDTLAWTGVVTPNDVSSLKKDLPDATFLKYVVQGNPWLGFDLTQKIFQDKRVRQALSMAMNRDDQVKVGVEGIWALPYGGLTQWYFDPKQNAFPNAKYYQYNLQEAKALLSAAGVNKLGPFDLIGSDVWTPVQKQQGELIQQQLRAIGVETNFKLLPYSEFYAQTVIGGKWSGGLAVSANLVGADPNEYFTIFWQPESPRIIAPGLAPLLQQDTELLDAIERQRRELDADKRKENIKDVVNIMADRMYNIPTTIPILYHVHQSYVKNEYWIFTYAQEYLIDAYKAA